MRNRLLRSSSAVCSWADVPRSSPAIAAFRFFRELQTTVLEPGLYSAILTRIVHISMQVQATEAKSEATPNDLQNVSTEVTLNWSRDPTMVRMQFDKYPAIETRSIAPAIQESVNITPG